MIPVEQTCPQCGGRHIGSDILGQPCLFCMGISEQTLTEALSAMNQMFYQEEETNDESRH